MPRLQLALERVALVLLEQSRAVGIRIDSDAVERVELGSAVEHVLVDLAVVSSQAGVELPVGKVPGVDESDGVGSNVLEELHDGRGACQHNLAHSDGRRGVKLAGLLLERVQSVEAEELVHQALGGGVEVVAVEALEGLVKVLDNHVLGVGAG